MRAKLITTAFTFIMMILTSAFYNPRTNKKFSLEGAWKIFEVKTVKENGTSTSTFPTESLVLFTRNYYSFCWTSHSSTSRKWDMADSVKLARFNQSIINSGTFDINDSILTTKALFAQNPMFVNGFATFRCSFSGDTLILTGLSLMSSENISNPLYASRSHIVNKLLRIKP